MGICCSPSQLSSGKRQELMKSKERIRCCNTLGPFSPKTWKSMPQAKSMSTLTTWCHKSFERSFFRRTWQMWGNIVLPNHCLSIVPTVQKFEETFYDEGIAPEALASQTYQIFIHNQLPKDSCHYWAFFGVACQLQHVNCAVLMFSI